MRIADRLRNGSPCFSFEFFPPKSEEGVAQLYSTLKELADLQPGFVSVTYGAGGSTRQLTIELTSAIKRETGIEAMAHLTCVGHGRVELAEVLERLNSAGIENVLALRGDPPKDQVTFTPAPDGFSHGNELMHFIRARGYSFCLGGACYPEAHLEADGLDAEIEHTRRKIADGAEFLITQLFFDNAFYFHFVERARKAGITCPIVPGLMPITNIAQIERITRMCGATVPMRLRLALEKRKDDPESVLQLGVAHATLQAADLLANGAPGVHFYTLNRSRASRMIVTALQVQHSR
ncbi:MAG TPA: methylenetetrahydrofolate reductase [NAD(P)H] [Polyangia bacterium]|jgi:methylenetetrahydrofolate reductase (NADPH)|nr:methylenetetrahydrofolate reductase [NAD(P)H] [Polyangia bacterium]